MKRYFNLVFFIFISAFIWGQEDYDDCADAISVCPNETITVNNIDATSITCSSCEDDNAPCGIFPENTIWLKFTTKPSGGDISINFSNLNFVIEAGRDEELQAALIEATTPCDNSTYTYLGNCESSQTGNFSITATGLAGSTTYYVVINGQNLGSGITLPAECTLDVNITGSAFDEPIPTIDLEADATTICQGDPVTLTVNTTGCNESTDYFWYVNGVLETTTTVNTWQTNSLLNEDSVWVDVGCEGICPVNLRSDTIGFSVTEISVDAGQNQEIGSGESATLNGSTSASTYSWSPVESLSDPNSLSPIASPETSTTYYLSASESNCTVSDSVTINVEELIVIPEAFTPNDDGVNDIFRILEIENYPNCLVTIYDRWGQRVFTSTGYTADKWWNGENGGRLVPSGTYFYVIELRDGNETVFRGPITVIY